MQKTDFYGRRVLLNAEEAQQIRIPNLEIMPAVKKNGDRIYCYRCGQTSSCDTSHLPNNQYYCPVCFNLGRSSSLACYGHLAEPNHFTLPTSILTWSGQLSPLQKRVSQAIDQGMTNHQRQLLWAVAGAGKTEMIFAGIAHALARRERIAIASPRVDVCLELFPRLQAAFANTPIALLHGRTPEPYQYRQLTICTTHQLLRFYHAFDNLIVDEVDSFPYAANQALLFATNNAVKKTGGILFMTATPGRTLEQQIHRHQLHVHYLPLRYHGHLLPQIKINLAPRWRKNMERGLLPLTLIRSIKATLSAQHQCLLFIPHIDDLPLVEQVLYRQLTNSRFTTVYAADPQRIEKVQAMRDGDYDFLITTSILERGVTFPEIDVYVLGADDSVFSSSALVQIAGRQGRAVTWPTGRVIFWVSALSRSVNDARRQISLKNRKGRCLQRELSSL